MQYEVQYFKCHRCHPKVLKVNDAEAISKASTELAATVFHTIRGRIFCFTSRTRIRIGPGTTRRKHQISYDTVATPLLDQQCIAAIAQA